MIIVSDLLILLLSDLLSHNRKRVRAFSEEQEHEIKVLFERFVVSETLSNELIAHSNFSFPSIKIRDYTRSLFFMTMYH